MKILDENFKQVRNLRQRQFRDKTAYVGGRDFRPKLRFSCSVATALQRFVPPCRSPALHFRANNDTYGTKCQRLNQLQIHNKVMTKTNTFRSMSDFYSSLLTGTQLPSSEPSNLSFSCNDYINPASFMTMFQILFFGC